MAGQWELQKKGTKSWIVNVTAQSALDFSIDVLEADVGGNSYQLTGNPIKGWELIRCTKFFPFIIISLL